MLWSRQERRAQVQNGPGLREKVTFRETTDHLENVFSFHFFFGKSSELYFCFFIPSTSGRLHSEFVRLLFLQVHRETDRFFTVSGVLSAQSDWGLCHYHHAGVSAQLKSKVGLAVAKAAALRITLI